MTGNEDYSDRASELLRTMASTMREHPLAAGRYLGAVDFHLGPVKEVALAAIATVPSCKPCSMRSTRVPTKRHCWVWTRIKVTWRSACRSCKTAHRGGTRDRLRLRALRLPAAGARS